MSYIVDNRDGTVETVRCSNRLVHEANATAFEWADEECTQRNEREGWTRFVPLRRLP